MMWPPLDKMMALFYQMGGHSVKVQEKFLKIAMLFTQHFGRKQVCATAGANLLSALPVLLGAFRSQLSEIPLA